MADGAFQHRHGGILLRCPGVQLGGFSPQTLRLHVLFLHPLAKLLVFREQCVHAGPGLVPFLFRVPQVDLQLPGVGLQRFQIFQPQGDLQQAHLVPEDQIFFRCLRLHPQRLYLKLQLRDLIVDPHQIFLCAFQLPLRFFLPVTVLGNTCRLLEDLPAVRALGGEDLIHPALTYNGIALPAHAGVHKQLRHVLQSDGLAVDVILALSAAVIPPGDGHLRLVHRWEQMTGVVQHQRHLSKAHRGAFFRAAEDHVLHFAAPEGLAGLLAHDPADGVGNVGLAGAVRPHDGCNILTEVQDRLIREGFEALHLQCF